MLKKRLISPLNLAFILVVLAAYLVAFSLADQPFSIPQVTLLVVLGLVYLLLGILGVDFLENLHPPFGSYLYFAIQIGIAMIILYFARINAWLLLLPLCSQTVFMLSRRGVLAVNTLILSASLLIIYLVNGSTSGLYQFGIAFLTSIFFVVLFTQLMVNEQKTRAEVERMAQELSQANQMLREYAAQVEELGAEQERNRLAREIHDGLGHFLTAIHMQIRAAAAVMSQNPAQGLQALDKAQMLTQEALEDVRRSVAALRSGPTLNRPLPEAIRPMVDEVRAAGLVADYSICGSPRPLPAQSELTLYRTVQEGLTNVRKHSLASRVEVRLEFLPEAARLVLRDNGVGLPLGSLDTDSLQKGFGLYGLRERVHLLGGTVEIQSAPGEGFYLFVELPG